MAAPDSQDLPASRQHAIVCQTARQMHPLSTRPKHSAPSACKQPRQQCAEKERPSKLHRLSNKPAFARQKSPLWVRHCGCAYPHTLTPTAGIEACAPAVGADSGHRSAMREGWGARRALIRHRNAVKQRVCNQGHTLARLTANAAPLHHPRQALFLTLNLAMFTTEVYKQVYCTRGHERAQFPEP